MGLGSVDGALITEVSGALLVLRLVGRCRGVCS